MIRPPLPSLGPTAGGAERPYLGAVLLILSGLIIGYVSIEFTMELILIGGPSTAIGLLFAALIFQTGVFALLRPDLSTFLGIAGVALSILSVVGGFGGLFVGLLIGVLGGNLLISWQSSDTHRSGVVQISNFEDRESSTGGEYSWRTAGHTEKNDTPTPCQPPDGVPENSEGPNTRSSQFGWQADPYARKGTGNDENTNKRSVSEGNQPINPTDDVIVIQGEGGEERDENPTDPVKTRAFSGPASRSGLDHSSGSGIAEYEDVEPPMGRLDTEDLDEATLEDSSTETRLEDALERVAHGAIVSFPSLLFGKAIDFTITTILTNGFAASSYGMYILAKRLVSYLQKSMYGFLPGLNRFLPTASSKEKDLYATGASLLMLGLGTVFGAGLFVTAPWITRMADYGTQFELFLRVFAIGLPGTLWLQTVNKLLEGLEEVEALNFLFRVFYPIALLVVAGIGTFLLHDFVLLALGEIIVTVFITLALTAWLMRERGFAPRVGGKQAVELWRKYVRFSIPLVGRKILENVQGGGFYLLIIVFLSSVAGGVFAVGTLVGSLIRLPLALTNQFIAPVIADLHDHEHREALLQLYQVTTRLILVGVTGLAIPLLVYREAVMRLFGPTFVEFTSLLPIFILAQYMASVAGSVSILLSMTDRQRAAFVIEIASALVLVSIAVPLTVLFGLRGLVVSYLVDRTVSNGLQMAALYYLEGYQPFTIRHAKPLLAAIPFVIIASAGKQLLSAEMAPLLGTLAGIAAYGFALHMMGFTTVERRLARSLLSRYRGTIPLSG